LVIVEEKVILKGNFFFPDDGKEITGFYLPHVGYFAVVGRLVGMPFPATRGGRK